MWNKTEASYRQVLRGKPLDLHQRYTSSTLGILPQDQGHLVVCRAEKWKTLGPDHSYTIDTADELASIYQSQKRLAKAEDMYQQVLKGYSEAPL